MRSYEQFQTEKKGETKLESQNISRLYTEKRNILKTNHHSLYLVDLTISNFQIYFHKVMHQRSVTATSKRFS